MPPKSGMFLLAGTLGAVQRLLTEGKIPSQKTQIANAQVLR